jgi:ribosome-binding protein aMBF1 (putative translation factor)
MSIAIASEFEVRGVRFVVVPKDELQKLLREVAEPNPRDKEMIDFAKLIDPAEVLPGIIGNELRAARETAGLTQAQLAKKLNRSQGFVCGAERGSTKVSVRYVEKVLKVCGLPSDWKSSPR